MTAEIGEILRMNYDGSALETVISNVPTASSIAIDPSSETIFWTSAAGLANGDGGVYRARFDGSGFEEIFLDTTFPNTNTMRPRSTWQTMCFILLKRASRTVPRYTASTLTAAIRR